VSYRIDFTQEAKGDLAYFFAHERRQIVDEVRRQLTHDPTLETRNRKELRGNPLARWELRIGRYRAFYEVDEGTCTVVVGAVGFKVHNVLYIRGEEIRL